MIDWNNIFKYFVSASFIVAAIVYLIKKIIEIISNRDNEKYKTKLQKTNSEHDIRYTYLHKKRAQIVERLFNKILDLESEISIILDITRYIDLSGEKDDDLSSEKYKKKVAKNIAYIYNTRVTLNELRSHFLSNRLYFTDSHETLIIGMIKNCDSLLSECLGIQLKAKDSEDWSTDIINAAGKLRKSRKDFSLIKSELKELMGISN